MKTLTVIFTCFNRKQETITAMKSLVEKNPSIKFKFIIVDDKSTDGTVEAIRKLSYDSEIINGTGNLFWCGGMRVGIDRYLNINDGTDCLLVNDDVDFYPAAIEKIVRQLADRKDTVIVGATCDKKGRITYGLRKSRDKNSIWMLAIEPNVDEEQGESMNANCVLIPYEIARKIGNMDSVYTHSLGDYDIGFRIHRMGYRLVSSYEYVGICEENSFKNTWRDASLSRKERLKKKESPKGSPAKEWWHFLYKNYGLIKAIKYSITPYVRILIGK